MINLKIQVGISGSGKSTAAHNQWLLNPLNTVIVNRDKIRELLFGYTEETIAEYYKLFGDDIEKFYLLEKDVTAVQERIVKDSIERMLQRFDLTSDFYIIVDDTNLHVQYINKWLSLPSHYSNVQAEIVWYDIDLETAILRDSQRPRQVGAKVITAQHERYLITKHFFNFSKQSDNING